MEERRWCLAYPCERGEACCLWRELKDVPLLVQHGERGIDHLLDRVIARAGARGGAGVEEGVVEQGGDRGAGLRVPAKAGGDGVAHGGGQGGVESGEGDGVGLVRDGLQLVDQAQVGEGRLVVHHLWAGRGWLGEGWRGEVKDVG